jgi:hypothetical protein
VSRQKAGIVYNHVNKQGLYIQRCAISTKQLYALYFSPNIFRVTKLRRMAWAGHVACIGERRGAYKVLVGETERRRPL